MDKTRIMFVFGQHGQPFGRRRKSASPKTKRYFRSAVRDFLKEEILENGRRVVVIHEFVLEPVRRFTIKLNGSRRVGVTQEDIADTQRSASEDVGLILEAFDRGMEPGLVGRDLSKMFGYIDEVLAMNRQVPGSVKNYFEPNCPQAVYEWLKAEWMEKQISKAVCLALVINPGAAVEEDKGMLAAETEIMRLNRSSAQMRDQGVRDLCLTIRRLFPSLSILVPRGLAHSSMVDLFDAGEFNIIAKKEDVEGDAEDLDNQIRLYSGPATPHSIVQYAARELEILKNRVLGIMKARESVGHKGKVPTG